MMRRWLIRALALALLTLCVGAWVGSYWRLFEVDYSSGKVSRNLIILCGRIRFARQLSAREGWTCDSEWVWRSDTLKEDDSMRQEYPLTQYHWAGLALWTGMVGPPDGKGCLVHIPLWFPTLLSALLLWLVWRKTRPKYNGRGFPVEAAGKEVP